MTDTFRALCSELLADYDNCHYRSELSDRAHAALAELEGPAKNCWLDDEPDLCPSPCVFDDPREVVDNCVYARQLYNEGKCKTNCQYYQPTKENS